MFAVVVCHAVVRFNGCSSSMLSRPYPGIYRKADQTIVLSANPRIYPIDSINENEYIGRTLNDLSRG